MSKKIVVTTVDMGKKVDFMYEDHVIGHMKKKNHGFCVKDLCNQMQGEYIVTKSCV